MKSLIVIVALAAAPALANELDGDLAGTSVITADQIAKSKHLPGTTIIRTSETDPNDRSVAFVKEKLRPGQKVARPTFEKIAMNAEKSGIAYDSSDELEVTSSTSSWVFGFRGPFGGGAIAAGGGYAGYGYGYGYGGGYGYPSYTYGYPHGGGYGRGCGCYDYGCNCYPNYSYAGYNYAYQPYYGYSHGGYNYTYCGWY